MGDGFIKLQSASEFSLLLEAALGIAAADVKVLNGLRTSFVLSPCAFKVASGPHVHAHCFPRGNEQRQPDHQSVVQDGIFPGTVLWRTRGRSRGRNTGFLDIGKNRADRLIREEFYGNFFTWPQNRAAGPITTIGTSICSKLSGCMNVQLLPSEYRNSMVSRSSCTSSTLSGVGNEAPTSCQSAR